MDAILYGGHVELERKRQARAAKAELKPVGEVDERPRDPMPSDEEIDAMHEEWMKGQNRSEAFRLANS